MAKAQILEALADRPAAAAAYQEVQQNSDPYLQEVAQARLARLRGDWAAAYRHFAAALRKRPQDIEVLNELEHIRAQMRPYLAARHLPPFGRGEPRPEEGYRPWQFSRFDREPGLGGRRGYPRTFTTLSLPWALTPETGWFADRSRVRYLSLDLGGGFWLSRIFPVSLAVGYQVVQQQIQGPGPSGLNLGLDRVFSQTSNDRTTWHRGDLTLGIGPLVLGETLKLRAEVSGRSYWRRLRQQVTQSGQQFLPFPPGAILNTMASTRLTHNENRQRLAGSLTATLALGPQTELSLGYARRDLLDQDPGVYPRLYQQWTKLAPAALTMLHQLAAGLSQRFSSDLELYTTFTQAFLSDHNRRTTLYQGLRWQLVNEPRSHLSLSPGYYLALHRRQVESYFSPHSYQALGVSIDFDRQFFRLPTLVLQLTGQSVVNQGRWGPAVATLVGLETEPIHNLYLGMHYFFFKEWATDYWLHSLVFGLNWRF